MDMYAKRLSQLASLVPGTLEGVQRKVLGEKEKEWTACIACEWRDVQYCGISENGRTNGTKSFERGRAAFDRLAKQRQKSGGGLKFPRRERKKCPKYFESAAAGHRAVAAAECTNEALPL